MPTTYIEVNLDAIAFNVQSLKKHIGPNVILTAVVKANAYGHGAVEVARTALQHGAGRLAVARVNEGVQLREAGITAPVLVMDYTAPGDLEQAVEHDLILAIAEKQTADLLSARAAASGRTMKVHIKIDSGMGRFGLLPGEVVSFARYLTNQPALVIEGMFSHFAAADLADKTYTRQQFQTFMDVMAALHTAGISIPIRHIANSAATLDLPEMHLDAVRTGIALYGLRPAAEIEPRIPLRPALALKSHVARVRTLPAGSSISYGRTFITPRAMPVALVPVGYGDGYHRLHSNRGAVLINGKRAPIVGRVCMDQFVVDISSNGPVAVNDEVVLIGRQGDDCITAEELGAWVETINYEAVTSLLPRATRFYIPAPSTFS